VLLSCAITVPATFLMTRRKKHEAEPAIAARTSDVERRPALVKLGAETLADALINLSRSNKEVDETLERLISTPDKNAERFKNRLANLSCFDEFVDWRALSAFVHELEFLLAELKAGVTNGPIGFELVVSFFDSEREILENCDDSGSVGAVFQNDAVELLGHFGASCDDKNWLCDQLMRLFEHDSYGVRSTIFDNAAQYLPEENVRLLITRLEQARQNKSQDYERQRWSTAIESLARQLKDVELFEQARRGKSQALSPDDIYEIARMRFDGGDAQTALSLVQEIDITRSHKYGELMLAIHEKLGNKDEQTAVAWRMFRQYRTLESLNALLEIIGEEQRNTVIQKQAQEILDDKGMSYGDAEFLIGCGLLDEAEKYLWEHASQLRGGFYSHVLPLAEAMEKDGRLIIATVLYRALLNALLERAYAKAYHHGVDYLLKLDTMAKEIKQWQNIVPHAGYFQELRISHGRKSSFWSQYEHVRRS